MSERIHYAIGDVHGEAERLAHLHEAIFEDSARAGAPATLVHLGDLVDRGPDSRGAVERVMALHAAATPDFAVVTVKGNHEQMMLDAVRSLAVEAELHWFSNGGDAALASYLRANGAPGGHWAEAVDRPHFRWMAQLPTMHVAEEGRLVFVHAGIEPVDFPQCSPEIHLWTRSRRFFDDETWPERDVLRDVVIVHGHTPTRDSEPENRRRRINVDTGAVFGGPLTAVVLEPDGGRRFLRA